MQDYIKWLEMNYNLVISKLKNNINTTEKLEAEVVIERKILAPSTALELAEVFEETLNLVAILESVKVELPTDVKAELTRLAKTDLTKTTELAEKEAKNDGNLAVFLNVVVNKVPFHIGMANFTDNMININFRSYEEGVESNV